MKSAYKLGWEARERNTNFDLNPFEEDTYKWNKWHDGWTDKGLELYEKSGLTLEEWTRYEGRILK